MSNRFFGNKRYRFSKELFWKRNPDYHSSWIIIADGKEVKVTSSCDAILEVERGKLHFEPEWCEEIEEQG